MIDGSISFMSTPPQKVIRIAVTGIFGYGSVHLRALEPLMAAGAVDLVAIADHRPQHELATLEPRLGADLTRILGSTPYFNDVERMLEQVELDILVIATPIPTHAPHAVAAMERGVHVLVEKPPAATLSAFEKMQAVSLETGMACQVGFQTFGSDAFGRIDASVSNGEIGDLVGIGAVGTWLRATDYYERAPWAGRRTLGGEPVVDGVVTNPLAHAVATALRIDHSTHGGDIAVIEPELFHAHDIEADDTSSVRIITKRGTHIGLGLTLCAAKQTPPRVIVTGTRGRIVFSYTEDILTITSGNKERIERCGRTSLLENLIDHVRDSRVELLSPISASGGFMRVLEAVRAAPAPRAIGPEFVEWRNDENGRHPVVADVEQWCERVATERRTFTALGAPWAGRPQVLAEVRLEEATVAEYQDGGGMSTLDSPRPHLHPVRTLGGLTVTDTAPADHTWHAGVGVAVQDVSGANLWGGRTYVRQEGYQWLADHGRIRHDGFRTRGPGHFAADLTWLGPVGDALARETRTVAAESIDDSIWRMHFGFAITNEGSLPLELGSPGSNGRSGGGYGGFFWRLPPCRNIDVRTRADRSEDAVHGTKAQWLAWTAEAADGAFTLVLAQNTDPWFVRAKGYPGIGAALAWEEPVTITPGETLRRQITAVIADGRLSDGQIADLIS